MGDSDFWFFKSLASMRADLTGTEPDRTEKPADQSVQLYTFID